MNANDRWQSLIIREFIEHSIPGEWGIEGTQKNGVPILRSTNFVDDGTIDYSDAVYRKVPVASLERRRINKGTILIEKAGGSTSRPAGRVVFCDRNFSGTASNFVEIVTIRENYFPKYVFYLLFHNFQTGVISKYQQQTTGIINFKIREYYEEIVNAPCCKIEQIKIAEILSTVDQAIDQTEALIAKQQRIKAGLMQDLLTRGIDEDGNLRSENTHEFKDSPLGRIPVEWEVKELNDLVDEPITYGIVQAGPHIENGIPYIRTGDMAGEVIQISQLLRTSPQIANSYKRSSIFSGDIIFALRATVGKVLPVNEELSGANLTQGTAKISPRDSVDSTFLFWAMRTSQVQNAIRLEQKGTTFMEITLSDLRRIKLALPKEKNEQSVIGERLELHDRLRKDLLEQKQKLQSIKTALMQDLLTGDVSVVPLLAEAEASS